MKIPKGLSSLHTHTLFCDGADDVETMCRAAFEKGLGAIGFSSHAPIARATGIRTDWHLPEDRLEEYISEVHSACSRWQGRLEVYLGLELDYIKGLRSALDRDIRELGLDFIIGSVHYIVPPVGEPFTVDGPPEELEHGIREGFGGDGEALMHAYWDVMAEMITLGGFDILGHVDLLKKNNQDSRWFSMESEDFCRRVSEITAALGREAGRSGPAAEINTGGLNRKRCDDIYPSLSFVKLLRENQVPLLISADAHRAEDLDGHYETAWEMLRAAGYTDQEIVCQNATILRRFSRTGSI